MAELNTYIESYFGVINPEELRQVSSFFSLKTIKKGEFYLQSGKICRDMCFVKSGLLRIYVANDEREITQWISTPGYFATDIASFMFETPARWNIQALSDTSVYSIHKTEHQELGKIVKGWPEFEKLFLARCFSMMEDRIFRHLSMSAEERYQLFFDQNPELFNQVPLQYIASMLGMTPETFSRIRKKNLHT
jgi:CRP/FNR family transcriptional regulator, anaerobic regulatory protein